MLFVSDPIGLFKLLWPSIYMHMDVCMHVHMYILI